MKYYTYTGENIKSEEFQADKIIFEGDNSEKIVEAGVPIQLSEDEVSYLYTLGFVLDKSSEEESEAVQSAIADWKESESDSGFATPLDSGEFVNHSATGGAIHQ